MMRKPLPSSSAFMAAPAACAPEGSWTVAPIRAVLLIGHSNAGKSPLGAAMESRSSPYGGRCHHLDFGELLRRTFAGIFDSGLDADERAYLRLVMDGRLLDDEHFSVARKIVRRFIDDCTFDAARDLLILNGMPRHCGQARDTAAMGIDVRLVIHMRCDAATALARKRLAEKGIGHENRAGRGDDAKEIFWRRIASFERETAPMLEYYRQRGVCIGVIDVTETMTPEEMLQRCAGFIGIETSANEANSPTPDAARLAKEIDHSV